MEWSLLLSASAPGATEEVAHAAYKALLADPMPSTLSEFRHAIMQAVLIGRVLESTQTDPGWQRTPPADAGVWEMKSAETGFEPSTVRVFDDASTLLVEDPAVGTNTLEHYHHNLIDIRWRPVVRA